jgi:hypothetical protein
MIALATLGLALSACASYVAPDGDANYDAIKVAAEQCQAKGGHLQLKATFDGRRLSDYECKSGEAK